MSLCSILSIATVLVTVLLQALSGDRAYAQAQAGPLSGIVDRADLLAVEERTDLRRRLAVLSERFRSDMFVVTIDDTVQPWAGMTAHRYMVDRAFKELDATRQGVEQTTRKLTIIVVFKHEPIVHLQSSAQELETFLYASKFYAGFEAARFKVRRSSHAAAAVAYLDALSEHSNTVSGWNVSVLRPIWEQLESLTNKILLSSSRGLWTKLDQLDDSLSFLGISKLISLLLSVLAFAAAVGIHALICVGILGALLGYPIKRLIGRLLRAIGTKSDSKLPDYLKVAVVSVVFTPIIAFIITIASYDVENFRFLSQRFDMPLDDLLERAKEAHRLDFQVTWFLAICATLILLALEFWALHLEGQLAARGDDGDGEHKRFEFKSSLQKLAIIAAQALALVVLPGAAAGFMFAYFVVERLFRITVAYRARATVAPKAQGQRAI